MEGAHVANSANKHFEMQVPNNTLSDVSFSTFSQSMADDFRAALMWHMETEQTRIIDLVRATGVSRDVINKLRKGSVTSTTVENAVVIAAYYGKSVNDFIARRPSTEAGRVSALLDLLSEAERRLLVRQIEGLTVQDRQTEQSDGSAQASA